MHTLWITLPAGGFFLNPSTPLSYYMHPGTDENVCICKISWDCVM